MKHRITEAAKKRIAEADQVQRDNAHALGVAVAEFELAREQLSPSVPNFLLRLGALVAEFEGYKTSFMNAVKATRVRQREAGEAALREVGIDPASGEYCVRDGVVMKLVDAQWVGEF